MSTTAETTRERAAVSDRIIEASAAFARNFNDRSFSFSHRLASHPAFEVPRLAKLAGRLARLGKIAFSSGQVTVKDTWNTVPKRAAETAEEAILNLDESNAWVELKNVQQDPEQMEILEHCVNELSDLTGKDLKADITWLEAYVFVSSPRSVTPYHIDHESNFLMQVRGKKELKVCYARDPSIVSASELEGYYMGDLSAAQYKAEYEDKAARYDLVPGMGVHIPSCSPHWVRNSDAPSISYSINFCARSIDWRAPIHQANHYLRKLGLAPLAPGRSAWRDSLKRATMGRWRRTPPQSKNELLRGGIEPLQALARVVRGRKR